MADKVDEQAVLGIPAKDTVWGPQFKWELPSRAVVACRDGIGCVLWWVGAALSYEIAEGPGTDLSDLGLDDAPHGVSVWEGTYLYARTGYWDDADACDVDPSGKFRKPTDEEWTAIRRGECPWDEADWLDPDYEGNTIEGAPMKPEDIKDAAQALLDDDPVTRAQRHRQQDKALAQRIFGPKPTED